jgi:hypothetical protein
MKWYLAFWSIIHETAVSAALFQGQIESVLGEDLLTVRTTVNMDDISVLFMNNQQYSALLGKIFSELQNVGLKVSLYQCQFMKLVDTSSRRMGAS